MLARHRRRLPLVQSWRHLGSVGALTLSLLTAPTHARGLSPLSATPEQAAEAQALYEQGVQAYKARDYSAAAKAFAAAYEVVASPNARMMYARALRDSGDTPRAFEEFLRTQQEAAVLAVDSPRYAAASEAAEREAAALQPQVAAVAIDVDGATQGLSVTVGARPVPQEFWSGVVVKVGTVDVLVRLPDGRRVLKTVDVALGQRVRIKVEVHTGTAVTSFPPQRRPTGVAVSGASAELPTGGAADAGAPPKASRPSLLPYAYAAGGLGAAGLLTFAIAGSLASSTYSDLEAACPAHQCPPERRADVDAGRSQQLIANVGLTLGLLGAAAGVTLWLWDSQEPGEHAATASPRWRVRATGAALDVEGAF